MGKRSSTETLFGIVSAFIERPTWTQADLARRLGTRADTIRARLTELQESGWKLERDEDHPHVYWSVPKNWFPGALAFKEDEAADVLRLVARAPESALRKRVMQMTLGRLGGAGAFDPEIVKGTALESDEEKWLHVVEDAARQRVALKLRYYASSNRKLTWRHVSVHRVDVVERPQFIATCHNSGELRRFRLSNVMDAKHDSGHEYRSVTKAALAKFDRESFGGFRDEGPSVSCAFFVREPESAWVAKNLPDDRIEVEEVAGGARFTIETTAVVNLARFVVGLGAVAKAESPELGREVVLIARAALASLQES